MLIKIGRSFVGRTVLIIAALISIMAALLFYCNLYATVIITIRQSGKRSRRVSEGGGSEIGWSRKEEKQRRFCLRPKPAFF